MGRETGGGHGLEPPVLAALIAVQMVFSGLHLFGKVVLESVHPLALACLRVLFATPLLLLVAWRRDRVLPAPRDLPWLALLGLLGVFGNQILFITGLRWTTATNAAILMVSIPVFAVALGAVLRIESIGPRRLAGIGLSVAGALAVLDPARFSLSRASAVGDLLVLANCLSFAAFLVVQKPLLRRLPWRTLLAWAFLFGSLAVLAVGGGRLATLDVAAQPAPVLWGIAYILVFPTFVGYLLNTWAVRRSSAATVAAFTTAQPVLTGLLAMPLLGERPGGRALAGFLLIAGGLLVVSRSRGAPPVLPRARARGSWSAPGGRPRSGRSRDREPAGGRRRTPPD